jgi:hypothetical protein
VDPVGAAARAGKDVIDALDGDICSQHSAEDRQFRTTETLARRRRGANRAVVFDEHEASPRVFGDTRHVALAASNLGKGSEFPAKRTLLSDELAVAGNARALAMFDQLFQPAVPEDFASGPQQIEGQIGMTVGEAAVASLRQPPEFPWPSLPLASVLALHQACRFELEEMLTRADGGHAEARADVGGGLRSAGLQVEQDAILAAVRCFVLTHDGFNLEIEYFLN